MSSSDGLLLCVTENQTIIPILIAISGLHDCCAGKRMEHKSCIESLHLINFS